MKKITITAIAFTVIFGVQLLTPNQSEAGMTCKTNYLGQVICTDSNDYLGKNSTTITRDYLGNDNYTNNFGQKIQTCRTDYLGNYVCN